MKKGIFIFIFLIISCNSSYNYNAYFKNLTFRTLENVPFKLEDLESKGIIINFYSPTCTTCIEELPSLHLLYEEGKLYHFDMFLAVESSLERNLPEIPDGYEESKFDEKSKQLLFEVLKNEILMRKIMIPMVLVDRPFRIDNDQIITGTPETLFFSTKPLNLHYNIVGPITTLNNLNFIQKDSKYIFAKNIIKVIATGKNQQFIQDQYK